MAKYCGVEHGVVVSNGTPALQIALQTLELEPGDEVIMPTFTFISSALGVLYNDAVPVLLDGDPVTWCMDVGQIEAKITDRTRAIMPIHILVVGAEVVVGEEQHTMRYFFIEELARRFSKVGLELRAMHSFPDIDSDLTSSTWSTLFCASAP